MPTLHLLAWRQHQKRSQKSVAQALGISPAQLWRYERERSPLPASLLIQLADLYGCPVDALREPPDPLRQVRCAAQQLRIALEPFLDATTPPSAVSV